MTPSTRIVEPVWPPFVSVSTYGDLITALGSGFGSPTAIRIDAPVIDIVKDVLIEANQQVLITSGSSTNAVLDGQKLTRIFSMQPGTLLVLDGIDIVNGSTAYNDPGDTDGGGIISSGTGSIIVRNCRFEDNAAVHGNGGAIYCNGDIDMYKSVVTSCEAISSSGAPAYNGVGGGLVVGGNAFILGTTFNSNMATRDAGGIYTAGSLTVSGGTISNNSAGGNGGGIFIEVGGSLDILNMARVIGNTAVNGGGIGYRDYNTLLDVKVRIGVEFENNSATRAFKRDPIDNVIYNMNIEAIQWTYPFAQGYNNVDIQYTYGAPYAVPIDVTLTAKKTVNGAPMSNGLFMFTAMTSLDSVAATNDASGNIVFPAIHFDQPGKYNVTVSEVAPWTAPGELTNGWSMTGP
ncbi:MAG: hypothetical protein LBC65_01765, partial [Oscillospiraceae bacterium]|nr:hypothetical protein [Oscillospiraceae bacterium]